METRSVPVHPIVPAVEGEGCLELPRWAETSGAPDKSLGPGICSQLSNGAGFWTLKQT